MDMLMNAAKAAEVVGVAPVDGAKTNPVNLIHMINVLARVYARTAHKFIGVAAENLDEVIKECMRDSKLLALVAKKGQITDADAVSLIESLAWTYLVVNEIDKPKIKLLLIEPSEMKGKNEVVAAKDNKLWNAFALETFDKDCYTDIKKYAGQGPESVRVLSMTTDLYEVLLKH